MPSAPSTDHASGCTRTVVINVVGLSARHIGVNTPRLRELARSLGGARPLQPDFPAVTCTSQSSMLTGCVPHEHGVVANGWFDREQGEARLWRQSNALVGGEKVWGALVNKLQLDDLFLAVAGVGVRHIRDGALEHPMRTIVLCC